MGDWGVAFEVKARENVVQGIRDIPGGYDDGQAACKAAALRGEDGGAARGVGKAAIRGPRLPGTAPPKIRVHSQACHVAPADCTTQKESHGSKRSGVSLQTKSIQAGQFLGMPSRLTTKEHIGRL
jgi:hypothetical protein